MTTEPFISAHSDPEGESPWALQCVVNESTEFSENALAQAQALAVVNFLDAARSNPEWAATVDRWKQGRIRKIIRRAKNAKWDKLESLEGVTTTYNGISIRVFVPSSMDEIPAPIKKCQVSGIKITENEYLDKPKELPFLMAFFNRSLNMSPGKTAVACSHVSHLMAEQLTSEDYLAWKTNGFPIAVSSTYTFPEFAEKYADVVIRDGGLTEVEPGSVTAYGFWCEREKKEVK